MKSTRLEKNIRIARWFGIASIVFYYLLALLAWFDPLRDCALQGLTALAAITLTFVGAVHWGRALAGFADSNQFPTLLFAVMPAVLGWFALILPRELALPMVAAGLVFAWGTEQMVFIDILPDWYRHLRHGLTATSVFALLIGWAAAMMPLL
ncbi:hypothetical protein A11A3_01677 [Alcanivorax hongdengensis A-11-3]|uniref:DUF3429 domain-containing protein n=1 Tax=Alcanivorax hongdengensis A-11-3 TaxID=1177179 RepID=L0WHD0_9GAMM|nr:DUF3429 domain-containing protein [Alcanivorax hongdengensis]EKF75542.1 hypothetical protein A11A3_01677 [Alcanivorax hongdengensis A-11-3]